MNAQDKENVIIYRIKEKGLEVFNCNPTNPDDGFTYTDFTSAAYCDGGLCRCYDPSQL